MMFIRILHALNALLFLAIGVYCMVRARGSAEFLGINFTSAQGLTDFRATYGGMCLACGAFFALVFFQPELIRAASWLSLFLFLGLAAGRAWGMFFEGGGTPLMWSFLVTELAFAAASVAAIRN